MTSKNDHTNAFDKWPWARTVGRNVIQGKSSDNPEVRMGGMYAICWKCKQTSQEMDIPDDSECPGCGSKSLHDR